MKKTILSIAVIATALVATAQESTSGYKAVAGSKTLEFGFAPLGGNPISISGIQFRSFMSDKMALRVNIFVGYSNEKEITQQADGTTDPVTPELTTKTSSLEIGLMPGVEMHMAGTDRLSPYMGLVLDIGFKSSKKKEESMQFASPSATDATVETTTTKGEEGFLRVGLMMPIGFDYYIANSLYLGAEMGIGVGFKKDATVKVEESWTTDPATVYNDAKGGSSINFGPTVNGKLRLGFRF